MKKTEDRKSREDLLKEIDKLFGKNNEKNLFPYHIYHLRFPLFKNYKQDLEVNFNYPITFVTGMNGIGKSSLLHALYGSIQGLSPAHFWFETALDPINEAKENKNRIICSFKTLYTKQQVETLVERMPKKNNPDYWEPSKPIKKLNMIPIERKEELSDIESEERSSDRWKQQKREVYYIDFRHMLGAYDKFFYFSDKKQLKSRYDIQKIIRREAKDIAKAFNESKFISKYKKKSREINKPVNFDENITKEISYILGKNYKTISYSEHNLYSKEMGKGFVMRYTLEDRQYSEAYAGSGESTIAKMIYDLRGIEENALILIDEPETSLHPLAQKRLMDYLLNIVVTKKAQVAISTHSPDIIHGMPSRAINVFYENEKGEVDIMENVNYENAFHDIGHDFPKKIIYVEDKLAKILVEKVLKEENIKIFEVVKLGGAEEILKYISVFAKSETKDKFFIFDGDQKFEKIDIGELRDSEKTVETLNKKIKELLKTKNNSIQVETLALNGSNDKESIKNRINFLDFLYNYVYFLSKDTPEEIIYSEKILKGLSENEIEDIKKEKSFKEKFSKISKSLYGENSAEYILKTQELFIKKWIDEKNNDYEEIKNTFIEILESKF